MHEIFRSRYRLVFPYILIVLISWSLRGTSLNTCDVINDTGVCFGQVDFFILLLSFPGWMTWMLLNLLPSIIKFNILSIFVNMLSGLSIEFNKFFIPSSFVLSSMILYLIGIIMERLNPTEVTE
jgi:hypothetical protein